MCQVCRWGGPDCLGQGQEGSRELHWCFPHVSAAPFQPTCLLLQGVSDLQTSLSGIFRHCGVPSLLDVTWCFNSTSPPSLPSLPPQGGGSPTEPGQG